MSTIPTCVPATIIIRADGCDYEAHCPNAFGAIEIFQALALGWPTARIEAWYGTKLMLEKNPGENPVRHKLAA